MQKDERDLLDVLKFELEFLEQGGYGRSPRTPWRPQYIFEDSLTCMNYDSRDNLAPCSECVLMPLVPPGSRSEKIPCRHIPFNAAGETLDSLYRYGTQQEIEEKVDAWLKETIQFLEKQRATAPPAQPANSNCEELHGTPLYQRQHPKCANPACATAFHWTAGGKFFRFRPDTASSEAHDASLEPPAGIHGVRHYWLCEPCSRVYSLVCDERGGALLKLIGPELFAAKTH